MFRSYRLGELAGIDVSVHGTFFLLLAWFALSDFFQGGVAYALVGTLFVLMLFGIVTLHELGHALAARSLGIPTRSITLLPIGGVAQLAHLPTRPLHELIVVAAGPLVNLVLAGMLYPGAYAVAASGHPLVAGFVQELAWVNLMLAGFNLLPAFPMDGGRLLRAFLAMRGDYVTATRRAARIGRGMAWVFGLAGLFVNPMLILIGIFVWFGATAEEAAVTLRARAQQSPLGFL
ncbi:MAG: site-2 protease family protein, partial [Candidatus Eremiobacterota bacterium]